MILRKRMLSLALAVVAASPVISASAHALNPAAAAAAAGGGLNLDPVTITQSIQQGVHANANREGFVKGLLYTAQQQLGARYNVMVFNLGQNHDPSGLKGVAYFQAFSNKDVNYGVWAFEEGVFKNLGDGGFINWAFSGDFERQSENGQPDATGKRVAFKKLQ